MGDKWNSDYDEFLIDNYDISLDDTSVEKKKTVRKSPSDGRSRNTTPTKPKSKTVKKRRGKHKDKVILWNRVCIVFIIPFFLLGLIIRLFVSCGSKDTQPSSSDSEYQQGDTADLNGTPTESATEAPTTDVFEETKTIEMKAQAVHEGELIVVNSEYEYHFPTEKEEGKDCPKGYVSVYEEKLSTYKAKDLLTYLDSETMEALNDMMADYYEATKNSDIMVIEAYHSYEEQEKSKSDIPAGQSDYHTGKSIGLGIFPTDKASSYYSAKGDYAWIQEHMADYGFVLRYPEGSSAITKVEDCGWQFRYVGVPHAQYMVENNLCLEQYLNELKGYSIHNPLTIVTEDNEYSIYYQNAEKDITSLQVPAEGKYFVVSGNNMDGFIVTVEME